LKNIERLNLRGNADLTDDFLDTLKTLHEDSCFSSRRAYINLDYREGNTFPAADADTGEQAAPFTMVDRNGDLVSFDMLKGAYIYI